MDKSPRRWHWVAVIVFVAIAVAVGATIVGATRSSVIAGTPTTTTGDEESDEDRLRDVVGQFEQNWNDNDFGVLQQLICADLRTDDQFSTSELREARQIAGRLALTIQSIDFDGATATAVIENHGAEPDDIKFVRELGGWTWCEP